MKNIVLSVVVLVTLVAGGLSGTLAHFSDTEESVNNTIQVGSMDLKVNGGDDPLVAVFEAEVEPCVNITESITLANVGQPAGDVCHVYAHFKNFRCENIDLDPVTSGDQNPEPEDVAQDGGWLGQVLLPGMGIYGDNCSLPDHIDIKMWYCGSPVSLSDYDTEPPYGVVKLNEILCNNIRLGNLNKGDSCNLTIQLHVQDIDEDDLIAAGIIPPPANPAPGDGGYFDGTDPDVIAKCWDHWPTNALMKDRLLFDMLFSLVEGP
jgi:predicted ribosomally synthesized peptide with SipW-like signal peptide